MLGAMESRKGVYAKDSSLESAHTSQEMGVRGDGGVRYGVLEPAGQRRGLGGQ